MLFLVSTVFLGGALDPFRPVKTFIFASYVSGGILIWLYKCLTRGEFLWVRTPVDIPLALLIIWASASFLYPSANRYLVYEQWLYVVFGAFLFYMTVFEIRSGRDAARILAYSLLPAFVVAVIGVLDLFRVSLFPWDHLIENRFFSVFSYFGLSIDPPGMWTHYFDGRISSTFGNPVYLAGYLVLIIPTAWTLLADSGGRKRRIYFLGVFLSLEFCIVATFTRSAWLCVIISLVALWFMLRRTGRKPAVWRAGIAAIAVFTLLLALWFSSPGGIKFSDGKAESFMLNPSRFAIAERVGSISDNRDSSFVQRWVIWQTAWEMVKANAVRGVGLGNYVVNHPYYQRSLLDSEKWREHISFPDRVHNEYLDFLAETGIVGLLILFIFILSLLSCGAKALKRAGPEARTVASIIAGGLGLLIYALVQFPFHIPGVAVYGWMMAGILVSPGGGSECREVKVKIWREARTREKALLSLTGFLAFLLLLKFFFTPVLAHAAFFQGVREHDKTRVDHILDLMKKGVVLEPYNSEMSVRFVIEVNRMAGITTDPIVERKLNELARDESIRGLKYNPVETRFYENLGNTYIKLGEPEEAVKVLKTAIYFNPLNAISFYNLGIAYYMTGKYNNSLYTYLRALEIDPGMFRVYQNLGSTYAALGKDREAIESFEKALAKSPDNKKVLNGLGAAYSRQGRRDEAISCYRQAIAWDPEYIAARGNLGFELVEAGDIEAGIEQLKRVIETDPESGMAHYHLGRAYMKMGNEREAVLELEKAKALMTEPQQAIKLLETIAGGKGN